MAAVSMCARGLVVAMLVAVGRSTWLMVDGMHSPVKAPQGDSKSYQSFVKQYRSQLGREPPQHMEDWHSFAVAQQCRLQPYQGMYATLANLRTSTSAEWRAGDIRRAELDSAATLPGAFVVDVRNGSLKFHQFEKCHTLSCNRIVLREQDHLHNLTRPFLHLLPDMSFVVNFKDEPRVFAHHSTDDAISGGYFRNFTATLEDACADTAFVQRYREAHGFFEVPSHRVPAANSTRAPVFTASKISACFNDILWPALYYWRATDEANNLAEGGLIPYEERPVRLFWRGSTTGTRNDASGRYSHTHRMRLVGRYGQETALLNGSLPIDIGYSLVIQADTYQAKMIRRHYATKETIPPKGWCQGNRFLLDVDGNTFSQRFVTLLECGSLVFKAGLFDTFYSEIIRPWVHYIPIDVAYEDLEEKLQWAMDHPEEAKKIAAAGNALAKTLKHNEEHCYMYRLLLEYGRLLEPAHETED